MTDLSLSPAPGAVRLSCDLSEAGAFSPTHWVPPAVVTCAFGTAPMHEFGILGDWQLGRLVADHPRQVVRSQRRMRSGEFTDHWDAITLQLAPNEFLFADEHTLRAYSGTHERAESLLREFAARYDDPSRAGEGSYHLLSKDNWDIRSERVAVPQDSTLDDAQLAAFYTDAMPAWDAGFRALLLGGRLEFTLFEGEPGTGKTSYVRHLIVTLRDTHRFYYIPPAGLQMVVDPEFVSFWAQERRNHAKQTFVVILEDADAAIMTREADNRDVASAILNLTDGLLGNFLRLQVLCTINCASTQIDPALLRPGRLLAHRRFARLPATHLANFPDARALPPRPDYTLAELFHGHPDPASVRKSIGLSLQP